MCLCSQYFAMSNRENSDLPPAGVSFRIVGKKSGRALFSRLNPSPTFGHSVLDEDREDQLWSLIAVETGVPDIWGSGTVTRWRFRNKHSGKFLSSWFPGEGSGAGVNDENDSGNLFDIATFSENPGYFWMLPEKTDLMAPRIAVFSRLGQQPEVGSDQVQVNPSIHDFSFLLDGMLIHRIEYHINRGNLLSSPPEKFGGQTFTNNTDLNQISEISITETRTTTNTFEHTHGFGITVGTKGKIGIPFVAEGQISVEGSTTHSWAWGSEITETATFSARFPVETRPGQTVTAIATFVHSVLEVPWTIYTRHVYTGVEVQSHGIFHGAQFWNVQSEYYLEPRNSPTQEMPVRVINPGTTEVHRLFDVKKSEKPLPVGDAETT